jgi:hypothetical protein
MPIIMPKFINCTYELHGDNNNVILNLGSIDSYYTRLKIDLSTNAIDDRVISGTNMEHQRGRMYASIVCCNSAGVKQDKLYLISQLITPKNTEIHSHGRELFIVSSGNSDIHLIKQEDGYEDKICVQAGYKDTIYNTDNNVLSVIM